MSQTICKKIWLNIATYLTEQIAFSGDVQETISNTKKEQTELWVNICLQKIGYIACIAASIYACKECLQT